MIIKNHLPQAAEPLVVDAATRGRRPSVDTAPPSVYLFPPTLMYFTLEIINK